MGQARPGSPGTKAELVVSMATMQRGRGSWACARGPQPCRRGAGHAGEGEQGLGSCVWDKGPPCSQETHVSNWILAAALWKRLLGKRKGNPGIQGCCPPWGHLVALPAWAGCWAWMGALSAAHRPGQWCSELASRVPRLHLRLGIGISGLGPQKPAF